MGKRAWIGMVAALMMAGEARSAPAADVVIAETQAALDSGNAVQAAKLADTGLNDETASLGQRGRLMLYRGLAEELQGLHDPAMRDFTAALNTNALPAAERTQALLQRGFLRDGLGQLDVAARDYSAVIALKGESLATALNNRANIYRRLNRFAEARRDYQAALSAGGGKPQYSWYGLGQIAEAETDPAEARRFYARAVAADPGYALASQRLEALGGPPPESIASSQDPIVLHPPASSAGKEVPTSTQAATPAVPARHEAHSQSGQTSDALASHENGNAKSALRPALDEAVSPAGGSAGAEVQLGAWRSEAEADAGWTAARLRAGSALDGFSPHIVSAEVPGKGRYYRLRVIVVGGGKQADFCANLSAKGVACFPARD
jgi:tetratricopeptide (TPR) repeat protein